MGTWRVLRGFAAPAPAGALALALALCAPPGPARCEDPAPLAPQPLLDRLAAGAQSLAARGRRAECDVALDVLARLGAPRATVDAARQAATKAAAKAKPAPPPLADAARTFARLAADLADRLPSCSGEARTVLARQVLRLDGAQRAAHAALGRVERDGRWVPESLVDARRRRAEIQDAVRRARSLPLELRTEEGWLPIVESVFGTKGSCVAWGTVSVHSARFSPAQLERQLRQTLRATALSNWLLTGRLEVPGFSRGFKVVFLGSGESYPRAIAQARATGALGDDEAEQAARLGGFHATGYSVYRAVGETDISGELFMDLALGQVVEAKSLRDAQPALLAGHLSWIYLNFLGDQMPLVAWSEMEAEQRRKGETTDRPEESAERKAMLRLATAGLAGSRVWMKWLARRGEDPAWSKSMLDQIGKIQGNELLKATLVVDMLHETEEFAGFVSGTWGDEPGPRGFERVSGGLAAFEERWREWLFADDPPAGLAQALGLAEKPELSPAEQAALRHLDRLRAQTMGADYAPALGLDRESSDGCRAHALYLALHPKQLSEWPGAHEEYPDQEGYSAAGARAGLSSVIAPGVSGPEEAVDGWMATFYHRLPLLDPGLVRIGWALEHGTAVLDAGSFVAPAQWTMWVQWPPPGAKGVPRRFAPELPNPSPGADQSQWGYPVTLQFFGMEAEPDVRMSLCAGPRRGGQEVPCLFATPARPTNPDLAPVGAFCLIPRQALAPGATYTVVVDGWPRSGGHQTGADWTFTTGAR